MNDHQHVEESHEEYDGSEIAIIGLACRFPGAANARDYWANLRQGVESIRALDDDELEAAGVSAAERDHESYVKAASVLDDVDKFDAGFFGYTPKEAEVMDPQQRLFLETSWKALEDAGYNPETYPDAIGVFGGARSNTYLFNLASHRSLVESLGAFEIGLGNDLSFLTSSVAYKLGLRGPAVSVQTACSTSLVAVHMACQSLMIDECRMALAGGVAVNVPHIAGYRYTPGSIASPDGHCRAFDAAAKGTVFGSGVGLVVLKRLEDAIADGDAVRAVIRGSAVNNDGDRKASFTAPGVTGQEDVILDALAASGLTAADISYVEAHGTGTTLGDPIEVRALTRAFREDCDDVGYCGLGSVKTNLGHLDAAAGIASLIKTVLALEHKELPATLHFEKPNPNIDFANSPFVVHGSLQPWETDRLPRRAGVSSFGIGGANAHVILEEAPNRDVERTDCAAFVLPLSAKSDTSLEAQSLELGQWLADTQDIELADAAATLQSGRKELKHRRLVVASTVEDASRALRGEDPTRVFEGYCEVGNRPVAFAFSGQGSQYPGMATDLYRHEPVFRQTVDTCAEILERQGGPDLRQILFPANGEWVDDDFVRTEQVQLSLFVVEYALATLWRTWGIEPKAMIGHSIGEYVAACLAGVFRLEDALALVRHRGELMAAQPAGAMLSVSLPEADIKALLTDELSLAAVNGPQTCVVAGPHPAIDALAETLVTRDVEHRRLQVSHAFHSAMMEGALEAFTQRVEAVPRQAPEIPFISNLTGTWITDEQAVDAGYWAAHLRSTVQFAKGLEGLLQDPDCVVLEVGPGVSLGRFVWQSSAFTSGHDVLASLRHRREATDDHTFILRTLGKLWLGGLSVHWDAVQATAGGRRISMPTYAFDHQHSYWIDAADAPTGAHVPAAAIGRRASTAEWLYQPSWNRVPLAEGLEAASEASIWWVFAGESQLASNTIEHLTAAGHQVVRVDPGDGFRQESNNHFVIDPSQAEDYQRLHDALADRQPQHVLHFWTLDGVPGDFDRAQDLGFYSLMSLAQTLGGRSESPLQIGVVSSGLHDVVGGETLVPERATLLGPCRVIPREYPHIRCTSIDVLETADVAPGIVQEVTSGGDEGIVALRGVHRWVQRYEAAAMASPTDAPARLRQDGTYLITGGLGGVGYVFAEFLAELGPVRLILTGRSGLPDRATWQQREGLDEGVCRRIDKVLALESKGAQVLYLAADAGDMQQMQAVLQTSEQQFGALHGVIHAAGVAGGGMIQVKAREEMAFVLRPKARAAWVLDQLLAQRTLDFVIQTSSITAVLGELGQSDYCAANAYLDALAQAKSEGETFVASINWDTWREVGMTVDMIRDKKVPAEIVLRLESEIVDGLDNREGVEILRLLLAQRHLPQLVVSTKDLRQQLANAAQFDIHHVMELMRGGVEGAQPRPQIQKAYVAPSTDTERSIVGIWQDVLGIQQIGVHDDFFELGGHSLLATRLIARIREALNVELTLTDFFETPTPASIAGQVDSYGGGQGDDETQDILDMLAQLTDDEAAAQLEALEEDMA